MKLIKPLLAALLLFCFEVKAATVDTVETYSPSMDKKIKAVIIRPDTYKAKSKFPVVYLLHGHGGNYAGWIKLAPELTDLSDLHQTIIVCPDGNVSSWYFDSPLLPEWKYETYVAKELVDWVDNNYKTIKSKEGRGITGLSMGGHGALYLAIRHQDVFGVAGSMSGGVDFRPFPKNWKIAEKLGDFETHRQNWEQHTVINMVSQIKPDLKLIIDCGTEDFFYDV
ncbi:esterase family protein, partial [Pseudoxanthomonas sp. SGD-10]